MTLLGSLRRGFGFSPRKQRKFSEYVGLRKQRYALRHLDDATLRDIGLTRDQAQAEARRPVWDVPCNWRK